MSKSDELARLKGVMQELGISANKALGQNFLVNTRVIDSITHHFPLSEENVVEIGPGLGALTERLIPKCKKLKLLEFDKKLIEYWEGKEQEIHPGDALKFDWTSLPSEYQTLISNLPYQISASLVINLSYMETPINKMVLMFQKEVAQRIQSKSDSKSYGIISVLAQNCWTIKKVADLSPGDFYPKPKISSRVLAFEKKSKPADLDVKFLKFVKHCFMDRRKVVVNKLKSYGSHKSWSRPELEGLLSDLGLDINCRAENISPENFVQIFRKLKAQ